MSDTEHQQEWLEGRSPADDWDARATERVLDELFSFARQYRSSQSFDGLLKFVAGFRFALQTGSRVVSGTGICHGCTGL
jgi:hypothetical protein